MQPDRVIVRMDRCSDFLSMRPDNLNTLTFQSAVINNSHWKPSPRNRYSSQNRGILQNFDVGLFQRHPGQCGNPLSLTGIGLK